MTPQKFKILDLSNIAAKWFRPCQITWSTRNWAVIGVTRLCNTNQKRNKKIDVFRWRRRFSSEVPREVCVNETRFYVAGSAYIWSEIVLFGRNYIENCFRMRITVTKVVIRRCKWSQLVFYGYIIIMLIQRKPQTKLSSNWKQFIAHVVFI